MLSISEAVREVIVNRPFLEDALSRQIINYNSLAAEIKTVVEKNTGLSNVKVTSIAMSLRRLADKYNKEFNNPVKQKLSEFVGSDMEIKYDLFEITLDINSVSNVSDLMKRIYSTLDHKTNDFLSITKGSTEITIITSRRYRTDLISICTPRFKIKNETDDLAALSIKIPVESFVTPGLFYLFTKVLTFEGINIAELVSTFSEMQFILDEEDVGRASTVIRRLLKNTNPFE